MKVLFLSHHCCSRVVREGIALMKAGVDVVFMQHRVANTSMAGMLPSQIYYTDHNDMCSKLQHIRGIDLIHSHNEPDWVVHLPKKFRPELPVVFDAHDLFSARIGVPTEDEVEAFNVADAFVYPSVSYLQHASRLYTRNAEKPNVVLYSMVNSDFFPKKSLPKMNSMVYEGGVNIAEDEDHVPEEYRYHNYRDYRELFTKLVNSGVPLTVFCGDWSRGEKYVATGAFALPPQEYEMMLQNLTRFKWSMVGGPIKCNQWDWAMPNKLFESIAAGVPVIAFNAKEVEGFVKHNGIGIVCDSLDDIPRAFKEDATPYAKRVNEIKHNFTMESQAGLLIDLYRGLI